MLKRKFRIPRGMRFNSNRSLSTPFFLLKIKKNGLLFNRFAIIVSKKIEKRAVVRNRIRRLISSCIEELYKDIKSGCDMIFIVKKTALYRSREEMCLSIRTALSFRAKSDLARNPMGSLASARDDKRTNL